MIETTICVRFDWDTTTIRPQRKIDVHFLLASNGSRRTPHAIHRSRIAIVEITALHAETGAQVRLRNVVIELICSVEINNRKSSTAIVPGS